MKILFYINAIHDGGAERVMTNLANEFSKDDEIYLITSLKSEWEYPLNERVNRIVLSDHPIKGKLKRNFTLIHRLRKTIKQIKPSVVVSFMGEPNFRACLATRFLKTKWICSVRNDPNKEYGGFIGKIVGKILLPMANGCVFQTEDAKKWFPKKLQKKSKIIYNAVNEKFFEANYQGERKNIVSCGRLAEQKNYAMLINAFAQIKDKISDNLLIYGEGPLHEELTNQIANMKLQDRVFLMGQTNNVVEAIQSAKLFVLSSNYEGMPNALMEAMTLGLACISTDCPCGGPKELIINEKNGVLIPINDENKMAEKLLIANDTKKCQILGNNAKNTAKENFHSSKINKEWYEYIKENLR